MPGRAGGWSLQSLHSQRHKLPAEVIKTFCDQYQHHQHYSFHHNIINISTISIFSHQDIDMNVVTIRFTMFLIEWPPFEYTVLLTIIGKIYTKVHHATSNSKFSKMHYTNTMHIVLHCKLHIMQHICTLRCIQNR